MPDVSQLRRRLGAELRAARSYAGLSQHAMSTLVHVSQKTVSRIESGERLPDRNQLSAWLDGADDDTRSRVHVLADAAWVETRRWADLRLGGHMQGEAAADEDIAVLARVFCGSFLPGLLQTAEYARLLLADVDPDGDVTAAVAARIARQRRLYDASRRTEFLIAEAALLWSPGDGVMGAQRDRLLSLLTLPSVDLAVLPSRRAGSAAFNDFILWTAPDTPTWVTAEGWQGLLRTPDPDVVAACADRWDRLWVAALHGPEAVEMIRSGGV